MSSSLYMYPAHRKGVLLSTDMKMALRKRCEDSVQLVLAGEDVPYIYGLRDGGVKGAQELIDFIEKHGKVLVKEES
jgi:hypothetical protein